MKVAVPNLRWVGILAALFGVSVVGRAEQADVGTSAWVAAIPPQVMSKVSAEFADEKGSRPVLYRKRALTIGVDRAGAQRWLLALQAVDSRYCVFAVAGPGGSDIVDLASILNCRIVRSTFEDVDGDHSIDALYDIRMKSPQQGAWVDHQVLLLSVPERSTFCRASDIPLFKSRPWAVECSR